ncbi:MAG: serine/threonine protein kinase [Proteobacteria bacterium]|nr:serine/threonine protein kinase [Pseudomonadota bacterium]
MLSNGAVIDRYIVDSIIGYGGTAVVYRVKHKSLGTWHALKVLSVTSRSIRERMLREGRVQATLDHLNIVTVTDVLEVDGQPGLLMEYIEGPSLEKALEDYALPVPTAETLFLGIVAGVRKAHDAGLVHRDLKPANVLLAETPAGFVPMVTDFGLAKVLVEEAASGAGQTRQGVAMGTPAYMAPEQIRDARSVDVRADVWSLGCILYELVTGQRTFPGDDTLAIYNAVVAGDIVPPLEYNPGLDPRFDLAIRGALAISRDERIPDCNTLIAVLRGERTWNAPAMKLTGDAEPTVEIGGPLNAPALPLAARGPKGETPPMPPTRIRSPGSTGGGMGLATETSPGPGGDPLFGPLPGESRSGTSEVGHVAGPLGTLTDDPSDEIVTRRRGPLFWLVRFSALAFILFWVGLGGLVYFFVAPVAKQTTEVRVPGPPNPAPRPVAPEPKVEEPAPVEVAEPEPPAPAPVAAPSPRPRPSSSIRPAPEPVVPPGPVTVKLLSAPPTAHLTVDGKPVGRTPRKIELEPGLHQVHAELEGTARDFVITVRPDAGYRWCYVFETDQVHTGDCP